MESNEELKEIDIKNRTCSYFDDMIKFEDFNLDNILINEKSSKNILFYNISYKNLIGDNLLRIWFDEIDGFIRVYDGLIKIEITAIIIYFLKNVYINDLKK